MPRAISLGINLNMAVQTTIAIIQILMQKKTAIKTQLISVRPKRLFSAKKETNQYFPMVIACRAGTFWWDLIGMPKGHAAILDEEKDIGLRKVKNVLEERTIILHL